jgi:hypothetical protein
VIVTVDDHELYPRSLLESLLKFYIGSDRRAVVAIRSRRIGLCSALPWRVAPYTRNRRGLWPETSAGRVEMLSLPTGTGGVLYRPRFFHPIVFDRALLNATSTGDDLLFRLATLARDVRVVTACALEERDSTCADLVDQMFERTRVYESLDNGIGRALGLDDRLHLPVVTRRSGRRRRRGLKGGGGKDLRKEVSLASKYNAGGGNNQMWADATALLRASGVLDLAATLERWVPKERRQCLGYMAGGNEQTGILSSLLDNILLSYQGMYDKECGMWSCKR